jgi:predicted transcriptional regulator YheO
MFGRIVVKKIDDEFVLLTAIMKAIAAHFGNRCEVVLHDWSKGYDKSIVAIENGQVTGRKVGDCGSNLGLEVMRGTVKDGNQFNYVTQTKDGKIIRSSSVYIKNDTNEAIGALCINYDVSELLSVKSVVDSLTMVEQSNQELFANDVNELLDFLLKESLALVGKPVEEMTKEEKMAAIQYLDEKGALLITKAGNKVCSFYNISKFTLYNYLDEIRENKKNSQELVNEKETKLM